MSFCFKQKTAYEMRISDWSSDVCSSDLPSPKRWPTMFRPKRPPKTRPRSPRKAPRAARSPKKRRRKKRLPPKRLRPKTPAKKRPKVKTCLPPPLQGRGRGWGLATERLRPHPPTPTPPLKGRGFLIATALSPWPPSPARKGYGRSEEHTSEL